MEELDACVPGLEVVVRTTGEAEVAPSVREALDRLVEALAAADAQPIGEVTGFGLRVGTLGVGPSVSVAQLYSCWGNKRTPEGTECDWFSTDCADHIVIGCGIFSIKPKGV